MCAGDATVASLCAECGAPVTFAIGQAQVRCEHCGGGLGVDRGARLVRLACPTCGGNFRYLDGSLTGVCPFCERPFLALARRRVLHFAAVPRAPAPPGADLLYLPFWQLTALRYGFDVGRRVRVDEAPDPTEDPEGALMRAGAARVSDSGPVKCFRGGVVDRTVPDPAAWAHGVTSLRYRAAVIPLEPITESFGAAGRVEPPRLSPAEALDRLRQGVLGHREAEDGLNRVDLRRADLVAESLDLIHYPFWALDGGATLVDGVTGLVEPLVASRPAPPPPATEPVFDALEVITLDCPTCGAALDAGARPSLLRCGGCGGIFRVERDGLRPVEARHARPAPGAGAEGGRRLWLPYWRVPVTLRYAGREAARVADLTDVLGLLRARGGEPAPADAPLHYFVPAGGTLMAPRIDPAARDLTRLQPLLHADPDPAAGGAHLHGFLSGEDARDLGYVSWIQVIPGAVPGRLRTLRVAPGDPQLWFIPFAAGGRELRCLVNGMRYDRIAFRGLPPAPAPASAGGEGGARVGA